LKYWHKMYLFYTCKSSFNRKKTNYFQLRPHPVLRVIINLTERLGLSLCVVCSCCSIFIFFCVVFLTTIVCLLIPIWPLYCLFIFYLRLLYDMCELKLGEALLSANTKNINPKHIHNIANTSMKLYFFPEKRRLLLFNNIYFPGILVCFLSTL
jgi:hypothetical protein